MKKYKLNIEKNGNNDIMLQKWKERYFYGKN